MSVSKEKLEMIAANSVGTVNSMARELLTLRSQNEWVKVSERLPELTEIDWCSMAKLDVYFVAEGKVWTGYGQRGFAGLVFWPSTGCRSHGFLVEEVSHWMPRPLPAAPEEV